MPRILSPITGVVTWTADVGATIPEGAAVATIESMKMEHSVDAPQNSVVDRLLAAAGEQVTAGEPIAELSPADASVAQAACGATTAIDAIEEAAERHRKTLDDARPEAVARRHARGGRTARENIADLTDAGSFVEYGPLMIAAQRRRRDVEDLIDRTPADGLVGGFASINADLFGVDATQVAVAAYDYTVLAGTQGMLNHLKKDRLFDLAARTNLPFILYTEGGGGRPGDVDHPGVAWLDGPAFALLGKLAGRVPTIAVNSGYCFAGNAALLGTCDVVIATANSNIGMAGPAMIQGGGLGEVEPTDIGPTDVHAPTGVVDLVVADEADATAAAKRLIGYTQGRVEAWQPPAGPTLATVIPADRRRVYDMRDVVSGLLDADSVLELRPDAHAGVITAFGRIEGRPLGIIANNPIHLAGAIDHTAALKIRWFMELCDDWGLPVLFLCDTPGFMVGPESDAEGLPRSAGALFRAGANLSVPFGTVVTRKGYGLGAMAMAGGGFKEPLFAVAWPTAEFGAMGLEGAVELGFSKELAAAAAESEEARSRLYAELVEVMYERGKALNVASHFEIDDVIDPGQTRWWVTRLLFESAGG